MTVISDSDFRNPNQLNNLPGYSSSRFLDTVPESVSITSVCQDSQNPSLVIINFNIAGSYYFTPIVKILDVDGDTSFSVNNIVAPLFLNDQRSSAIPINTYGGVVNGRIVADFGRVIPNFLYAQLINFELRMEGSIPVSYGVSFPAQTPRTTYLWSKGVLPTPVDISYVNGVIQVYFQYNGQVDCSCNIQCVEPSGVSSNITFCPNDTQSITINQALSGDPFTFNLLLSDGIGNLSEFNLTSYINVTPSSPIVALKKSSKSGPLRAEIGISNLSTNGVAIAGADYQIIKYINSPHNYIIWKDWSERPWTNFIDYEIKPGNTYGYAVRYKGKFNDISNLSQWTTISTVDKIETPPLPKNFGAWTRAWNHNSDETDPTAAFSDITQILSNIDNRIFPKKFNAIHMSLIPKGPQRGSVIVWDKSVIAAKFSSIDSENFWSVQAWAVVDPSDTPFDYVHRNYILPIGPIVYENFIFYFPNLFCAGQTWSPHGDLIVAGGVSWSMYATQYGDSRTYAWNPAAPTSFLSGPNNKDVVCRGLNGGHYGEDNLGYGAWVKGPGLTANRYYPTLTLSPSISRQSGKPAALIFGGTSEADFFDPNISNALIWNSYEGLVTHAQATSGDCGYYLDKYNGSSIFNGPSITEENRILEDGLYFYPRMFVLSNGGIFMSSFSPRSSTLVDHDTQPGVWSRTNGYNYVEGLVNNQRYYGSSVLMPNIDGQDDVVVRIGGRLGLNQDYLDLWDTNTTEFINAGSTTPTDWRLGPPLNKVRSVATPVILPDGAIMIFGGVDADETVTRRIPLNEIPPQRPFETSRLASQVDPLAMMDHHHSTQPLFDPTLTIEQVITFNSLENNQERITEERKFLINHYAPEILFPGAKEWILMDWAPAKSPRNYHCTAVLLPDTRVLVAGGEDRTWDYEIFEPHYLKPGDGSIPNKPKNIIITDATIDSAKDHGAYDLSYNTEYTLECDNLYPDRLGKIVLMSPGSCTHHSDMAQRYRELQVSVVNSNKVKFKTPLNDKVWQKGFHMLFALSNKGIPANAIWVKFS